jgi:hypothetical protein
MGCQSRLLRVSSKRLLPIHHVTPRLCECIQRMTKPHHIASVGLHFADHLFRHTFPPEKWKHLLQLSLHYVIASTAMLEGGRVYTTLHFNPNAISSPLLYKVFLVSIHLEKYSVLRSVCCHKTPLVKSICRLSSLVLETSMSLATTASQRCIPN